jgi:hypothetical protein
MEQKTLIKVTGEIVDAGELQTFGKFTKRVAVLKVGDGKYPNFYPFTFKGEALGLIDGFAAGDIVTVEGYVNGNRWQKKDASGRPVGKMMYFLEIAAKSLQRGDGGGEDAIDEAEPMPGDAGEDMPF